MSYFLPSIFQKRLLRYALSRLELVDTYALDLDSLGITWGQRSTFELKDIELRLEVCSASSECCLIVQVAQSDKLPVDRNSPRFYACPLPVISPKPGSRSF